MGTVPYRPETEEEAAAREAIVAEKWAATLRAERIDRAKQVVSVLATGVEGQPWRRPALFITVAVSLAFAGPLGALGLAALVALVYTDRVYTQEAD